MDSPITPPPGTPALENQINSIYFLLSYGISCLLAYEVLTAAWLTITEGWVEPLDAQGEHSQVEGAGQQVAHHFETEGTVEVQLL